MSVADTVRAAEFFLSDGIIVTGAETGQPASTCDVDGARGATELPLIIGSGVTEANLHEYRGKADALVVGSHFKVGGRWHGDVAESRVKSFMDKHRQL